MIGIDELLQRIIDLLNSRPGVSAADAMATDETNVHIRFRCRSFEALEEVLRCIVGANAGALRVVEPDFRSRYESNPEAGMWFFLDIEECHHGESEWTKTEVLHQMLK